MGPYTQSTQNNKYILSIMDHFSRYLILVPTADTTAETIANAFVKHLVLPFGSPDAILTDQGQNFLSSLFVQVCKLLRIKKWRTTPYHPQANGRLERVHKTIGKMLSYYVNRLHTDWDRYVPYVASAYNSRVHESTGYSPYEAVFGRPMSSPFELDKLPPGVDLKEVKSLAHHLKSIWKRVKSNNANAASKQRQRFNKGSVMPQYKPGDLVLLRNPAIKKGRTKKFTPQYEGPYPILRLTSPVNAELQLPERTVIVHFDRLKPYHGAAPLPPPLPCPPQPQVLPKVKKKKKILPERVRPRYALRNKHPYALRSRD